MANIGNSLSNFQNYEKLSAIPSAPSSSQKKTETDVKDAVILDNSVTGDLAVEKKKWTVLLYSAADNNLEKDLTKDVIEMESAGSNKNMNLVVQLDRGENPSEISDGWAGCKRFYLNKDDDSSRISSPSLKDMGQVNMSDPKVLADFIEWGIKNYPAEHYMLILSDHGYSWEGALEDASHRGWMSVPDMGKAIDKASTATGEKIDILGFDACLMASTEVAYELKDSVDYIVASQDLEGAEGWPYTNIFTGELTKQMQKALNTKFTLSPELIAKGIVTHSESEPAITTLSALDMSKVKELSVATDEFAKAILETEIPLYEIKNVVKKVKTFEGFRDHGDFAKKIIESPRITDEKIKETAKNMLEALQQTVMLSHYSDKNSSANGLNLEISRKAATGKGDFNNYHDLAFAKDTLWDEAMAKVYAKGKRES